MKVGGASEAQSCSVPMNGNRGARHLPGCGFQRFAFFSGRATTDASSWRIGADSRNDVTGNASKTNALLDYRPLGDAKIAQQPILEIVNPAMNRERFAAFPRGAHGVGERHIANLRGDIEFAETIPTLLEGR